MKKFITAVAVVAAMTTPVAFAHQNFGHRDAAFGSKAASKLNLTDAQKQQIHDIRESERAANQALIDQFQAKRRELRTLRQNNDPNFEAAKADLKSIAQQLHAARKAMHEKIYNTVLTAEQRSIVDQWRSQRQGRK